jgi:hypothetical protein
MFIRGVELTEIRFTQSTRAPEKDRRKAGTWMDRIDRMKGGMGAAMR